MVELTRSEMAQLAEYGLQRVLNVIERQLKDPTGKDLHTIWSHHIEGALREGALIKHMTGNALARPLHDKFKSLPDTTFGNVRGTHHKFGCLIIPKDEIDSIPLWFVIGCRGKYHIIGSVIPTEVAVERYWRTDVPKAAYFIPQADITLEYAEGTGNV